MSAATMYRGYASKEALVVSGDLAMRLGEPDHRTSTSRRVASALLRES